MSRHEKLIQKFTERPESLQYNEIESILLYLGFVKQYGKGSHVKFRHRAIKGFLVIAVHHRECLNIYKKEAAKFVQILFLNRTKNEKK